MEIIDDMGWGRSFKPRFGPLQSQLTGEFTTTAVAPKLTVDDHGTEQQLSSF